MTVKTRNDMPKTLVQLKASVWPQAHSPAQIFPAVWKSIRTYFASPYRIGLIVLFSILFLPHIFVMVEDISLAAAFEVDPGSIIESIQALYYRASFYNMNIPYHPKYYGWTYFFVNFFLAAPVYLLMVLNVLHGYSFFLIAIRLLLFLIGLASLLAFFEVARRVLRHGLAAFVACLLYIAAPATSKFFYFLHPETTGLLFLFLGILCLFRFHDGAARELRWYVLGLLCLVLSALSKQVFLITALPVLFLFLYIHCYHHNVSMLRFMLSKQFWKTLLGTALFSLLIFFIINPYAFLQLRTFLTNQMLLFAGHTHGTYTEAEATKAWLDVLKDLPVVTISILLSPVSLLVAILFCREQKVDRMMYVTNLVWAIFFTLFTVISIRLIIYEGYLAPVYPFFILNIFIIFLFVVRRWKTGSIRYVVYTVLALFLAFVFVKDLSISLPQQISRLRYKESLAYKSYHYIETNIPKNKKIAHDHFVAVPSDRKSSDCSYWRGCGTKYINAFRPDYVMIVRDWTFEGVNLQEKLRLIKYIDEHDFVLVDTIQQSRPRPASDLTLEVWKRPDQ